LHGSPNAGPKWAPLAAQLPDFRCLLLDRPGCGLSEPIDYAGVDLRMFGAGLLSLTLTGLNVPTAAVVASSLGGALAFYFTRVHPARVVRLVQEGCPAFVHGFRLPLYTLVWSVLGLLGGPAPRSETAFRRMGHATSIDRGRFHTNVLVWRDALLRYTATGRHENALNRHLWSRMRRYRYGAEVLGQITAPTLYLWGDDDPFGGVALGQRCAAAQPNAALRSFPPSGYLPWLDDPATHAQCVRAFLRGEPVERITGAPDEAAPAQPVGQKPSGAVEEAE
jgi:pimeloyl-ACP methyl ester carboxylesterase